MKNKEHIFWLSLLAVGALAPLLLGQSANDIEFKQYDGTKWIWKSIPTDAYILGNTTLNAGKTLTINGALNSENGSLTLGDIDVTGTIYAGDNGKTAEFAALKTTILNPLVGDPGSGIIDLETSLLGTGNWNVGNGNLSVQGSVNTQSVLSNPPGDVKIDVLNSQLEGNWETTGRMLEGDPYHAYGGWQDTSGTIDCTAQNAWVHLTNAGNNLLTSVEAGGFQVTADTIIVTNSGDYTGNISLTFEAAINRDYEFRLQNVTQGTTCGYHMGATGMGANNDVSVALPVYIEATAADVLRLEVRNTTNAEDVIVLHGIYILQYLHE